MTIGPLPAPFNVPAAAAALLDAFVTSIEAVAKAADWVPDDWSLPERQGQSPGSALAWDTELLAVNFIGLTVGQPGKDQTVSVLPINLTFYYDFEITILREVPSLTGRGPTGGFPLAAKLNASADVIATDAALMMAALVNVHATGAVVQVPYPFRYGPLETVGPMGKLAGSHVSVSFQAGVAPIIGAY